MEYGIPVHRLRIPWMLGEGDRVRIPRMLSEGDILKIPWMLNEGDTVMGVDFYSNPACLHAP
jgi:hypothetical protein